MKGFQYLKAYICFVNKSMVKRILYILAVLLSIVACSDEIDKSNRYTFTGETVADFLLNRSEKYSHFITLSIIFWAIRIVDETIMITIQSVSPIAVVLNIIWS